MIEGNYTESKLQSFSFFLFILILFSIFPSNNIFTLLLFFLFLLYFTCFISFQALFIHHGKFCFAVFFIYFFCVPFIIPLFMEQWKYIIPIWKCIHIFSVSMWVCVCLGIATKQNKKNIAKSFLQYMMDLHLHKSYFLLCFSYNFLYFFSFWWKFMRENFSSVNFWKLLLLFSYYITNVKHQMQMQNWQVKCIQYRIYCSKVPVKKEIHVQF